MKVVILNGGKGTRLGLTDKPKPMVDVAGTPLLERLVLTAKGRGLIDFVFLNGHLAHVIEGHFGDGTRFGVHIKHVTESVALGTAGAIREARALLTEPFLVLYGDVLIDVDLAHFAAFHEQHGAVATLFVHPNDHPYDSDLVESDDDGFVTRFLSKPHPEGQILPNLVSGAIYVLDPQVIEFIPPGSASDWGHDIFPALVSAGKKLMTYRSLEYAKDVGTPDRLARGEADLISGRVASLSRRNPKAAIFIDRDGVINIDLDGVHGPKDLTLIDGAAKAIRDINVARIPAICVTNQPDIAKGLFTRADLMKVFAALDTELAKERAFLDDVYYCPHHPERGWKGEIPELKIVCNCRKPQPGMLLEASNDHNLDLGRSWFIGDRYADIEAARRAGTRAILVTTGHAGDDKTQFDCEPDYIATDLNDAVQYILGMPL